VKLTTLRPAAIWVFLSLARLSLGQTGALTLESRETHDGATVRLELLLNARSNSAPAGLQWEFKLPPGLDIVGIEAGKAANESGKTLVCNRAKCIVYGLNRTTIPNGPIAVVKIKVNQSLAGGDLAHIRYQAHGRGRMRKQEIKIDDLVAVSLDGKAIKAMPGVGLISASKIH
jgi:hypothetical protein